MMFSVLLATVFLVVIDSSTSTYATCVTGDWEYSFDQPNTWSTCPNNNPLVAGFTRSRANHWWVDFIGHLEGARCCSAANVGSYSCKYVDWTYSIRQNWAWNLCPNGYFLSGLYRNNDHFLTNIVKSKCCKPKSHPYKYKDCYDEDIGNNFNHQDHGMRTCRRNGYYMTGIFRSDCGWLFCHEKFRCCSIAVLPCDSSPCLNGGTCSNHGNTFKCNCPPGYTGGRCENKVQPCDSSPCLNGGTCSNHGNTFKCNCPPGYTGGRCENKVLPCDSSPCLNGGTCSNNGKEFKCECPSGYTGDRCEHEVLPCDCSPCFNGGTCSNNRKEFKCECPPGYTGDRCEFEALGCWKDKGSNHALSELILNERKDIDWENYDKFLTEFIIRCAKVAIKKGYSYIGLQYYGECWSGPSPGAENSYKKHGKSKNCLNSSYKPCTSTSEYCIGKENTNFVFKIHV